MKRITLFIAILFTLNMGLAQEEVAIEQRIEQPINTLEINRGWDVHLLHNEADSGYRVAIVTNEDYAPFAFNVQLCSVKGDTLTILDNTQLPRGTVVEVEGPMKFQRINLMNEATVKANQVIATQSDCRLDNIFISRDADFHIQHYLIPDSVCGPGIEVWERSKLTLDTISGTANAAVKLYESDFQIITNQLNGKIILYEYEVTPGWHYQQTDWREIKSKGEDGIWITTDHKKIWNNAINIEAGFGYRLGTNPKNADSPFLQNGTLSINFGLGTYFNFSNHWGLRTGLQMNMNRKYLCHQVSYEDNALVVIDGQGDYQRNTLSNTYLGIPISLNYYLGKQQTESFSLDLFCGRLIGEVLRTSNDPTLLVQGGFGYSTTPMEDIFNPWKLEVGLSFNTNHLGVIHGVRVFTNLLPECKPGVTDEKFRSIGIELKL
ncbi:MAG: outer membrane beta-barrel protein [Bacteroidales bacterium]|nr:outer membrane beta-barrel protein [Bacteroidales bacterium]